MIALTNAGTADKIDVVTTGAAVSIDYSCSQSDKSVTETNPTSLTTKPTVGNIASATTTKITVDPASGHEAFIREISLVNVHASASCTVQLQQTINAGTARKLTGTYTLAPGERLLINADGTLYVYDAAGGVKLSVASALTVTVLTSGSAATYNTPAGCRAMLVECVGGGGAGGGASSVASAGGGGGGGGAGSYTRKMISPPAASYTYTVGAGGTAGTAGANAGNNGADTTFGSLTAKGGTGGAGCTSAAATRALGGAGGIAGSGGDINMPGQPGVPGVNTTAALVSSGNGGNSFLGGGALGVSAQGAGAAAVANTGGGGSGGASVSAGAAVAGGAGGSGVIVITEFY
jgi:hypothetical protein